MRRVTASIIAIMLASAMVGVGFPLAEPASALAADPKVAIVHSTITKNATYPGLNLGGPTYDSRVADTKAALESEFTSVTQIGDAALRSLSTLENYDVIVAPRLLALDSQQRQTIRAYIARGGGVVASFGMGRWDYVAGRSPNQYEPLISLWQFSDSWDMSRVWEWGELSEPMQVKFANDPLTYANYDVVGKSPSTHQILSWTSADLGGGTLKLDAKQADYNELVWAMPSNSTVKVLATYQNATTNSSGYPANNTIAGWAAEYYLGRMVYFGFQLHDMARSSYYTEDTLASKRLLLNSVRWAGAGNTYGHVVKKPTLSGNAWFTRGKLYIDETVKNEGTVQLRGKMRIYIYKPNGALFYSGVAKNQDIPLPTKSSYTYKSWQPSIGTSHQSGTWTIKMTYEYFDYFNGGTVTTTRYLFMSSTGTSMKMIGHGTQAWPSGSIGGLYGSEIAGTSRYDTGIELSKTGFPAGVSPSRAVILATGKNYPDALAAAPLAGKLDAPTLLVPPTGLTANLKTELARLYSGEPSATIYVMGSAGAVPDSVVQEAVQTLVGDSGNSISVPGDVAVVRLAGGSRYATAAKIAEAVGTPSAGPYADTVIIASGEKYADALAISPTASSLQIPILLVRKSVVPDEVSQALQNMGASHAIIVGGTGVVSTTVESWLESNGHRVNGRPDNSTDPDTRLHGQSRYDTGLACLDFSVGAAGFDDSSLYVATGTKWPDALALAGLAGKDGTPALLLNGSEIGYSPTVAKYLVGRKAVAPNVTYVGGAGAVNDYVRGQVTAALDK